jgi:flagellar biosynthesis protein FliQ
MLWVRGLLDEPDDLRATALAGLITFSGLLLASLIAGLVVAVLQRTRRR